MILLVLVGADADEVLKKAGMSTMSSRATAYALGGLPPAALMMINKAVGFRLMRGVSEKTLAGFGRGIPLAGGLIGGGLDGYMMKKIADHAMKELPTSRLTPGPGGSCRPGGPQDVRQGPVAEGEVAGEVAAGDAVPAVAGEVRGEQRQPGAVLGDPDRPVAELPQPPVQRAGARAARLGLDDQHVADLGGAVARHPAQVAVDRGAAGAAGEEERRTPVAGVQRRDEAGRVDVVDARGAEPVADPRVGVAGDVRPVVRQPLLDGRAAQPARLHLEPPLAGVGVDAAADLPAAPAAGRRGGPAVEVDGVEVRRLVARAAAAVDLEHPQAGDARDHGVELARRDDVLAVGAGQQLRDVVELVEGDGGEAVDTARRGGHRVTAATSWRSAAGRAGRGAAA